MTYKVNEILNTNKSKYYRVGTTNLPIVINQKDSIEIKIQKKSWESKFENQVFIEEKLK